MANNFTTWKKEVLIPALFNSLDIVLPQYDFTRTAKGWQSRKDFEQNQSKRKDRLVCNNSNTPRILENGSSGQTKDIITAYMDVNGYGSNDPQNLNFWRAIDDVCKIVNIAMPEFSDHKPTAPKDTTDTDKATATQIIADALSNPSTADAQKAKDYLLKRFTPYELQTAINKNLLGYVDNSVLAQLHERAPLWNNGNPTQAEIGATHRIAIIDYSLNRVKGYNFRVMPETETDKPKYVKPSGSKRNYLGGLEYSATDIIMVEGEIDRLKAMLAREEVNHNRDGKNKFPYLCVCSCGSNILNSGQLDQLKQSKVKIITIIPDADKKKVTDPITNQNRLQWDSETAGNSGAIKSIEKLHEIGINVYVAELPNTRDYKIDTAEYINRKGFISWYQAVTNYRKNADIWRAELLQRTYLQQTEYYGMDTARTDNLIKEIASIAIYSKYGNQIINNFNTFALKNHVDKSLLVDAIGDKKKQQEQEQENARLLKLAKELQKYADMNDFEKLKAVAENICTNTETPDLTEFLVPCSCEDMYSIGGGLETNLTMLLNSPKNIANETDPDNYTTLALKEGLTLVCGAKKNGKTTFIANVAINQAVTNYREYVANEGAKPLQRVILATYEVRGDRLKRDLLAIFLYKISHDPTNNYHNLYNTRKIVSNYFDKDILPNDQSDRDLFLTLKKDFETLLKSGALLILDFVQDTRVEKFVQIYKYLIQKYDINLVCMDYYQKFTTDKHDTIPRHLELKTINQIVHKELTTDKTPLLASAQFGSGYVKTLPDVDTDNIGESTELGRGAVDVIGLYNLKELKGEDKKENTNYKKTAKILRDFKISNFEEIIDVERNKKGEVTKEYKSFKPVRDKLYIKLMSSRYNDYPAHVIADFYQDSAFIDFGGTAKICVDTFQGINNITKPEPMQPQNQNQNQNKEPKPKPKPEQNQSESEDNDLYDPFGNNNN